MREFLKRLSLLADSHDNLKAEVTELSEKQSAFGNVLGDIAERTMSDADADRSENEIDIRGKSFVSHEIPIFFTILDLLCIP